MAKGQKKGNKEARKPKKEGPAKTIAANPSTRGSSKPDPSGERAPGPAPDLRGAAMSKVEDYTARAAASLAAAEAAINARDRAFHQRAHSVWRKLIAGVAAAEERAAMTRRGNSHEVTGGARR